MRSARAWSACLGVALLLVSPRESRADDENREQQRARLYKEGLDLAGKGRWDVAVEKFRRVVALRSAPPALFTLAQAEEHVGNVATAERTYQQALSDARAIGNKDVADAAEKALRSVAPRVPAIVVRITAPSGSTPADAVVSIDGRVVAAATPERVDPGSHAVAVRASGMKAAPATVDLHEAETRTVTLALTAEESPSAPLAPAHAAEGPPPTAPAPREAERGRPFPVGPVVLASAGVAAAAAGLFLRVDGQGDYDDAASRCPNLRCSDPDAVDDGNAGRTRIVLGTVVLGAASAAVVGAGLWWILGRPGPSAARTGVAIVPSADGVTAAARARW